MTRHTTFRITDGLNSAVEFIMDQTGDGRSVIINDILINGLKAYYEAGHLIMQKQFEEQSGLKAIKHPDRFEAFLKNAEAVHGEGYHHIIYEGYKNASK